MDHSRSGACQDPSMAPQAGDKAPAFTLTDQDGGKVRLTDLKGRKVLVYFYPKADTPGCTTQSCGLRDIKGDVGDTVIIGISPDKPAKLEKFDTKYSLGFPLLSDEDHAVAEAYGAWGEKKNYGRTYEGLVRSTVVVGPDGRVTHAQYNVKATGHVARLRRTLGVED